MNSFFGFYHPCNMQWPMLKFPKCLKWHSEGPRFLIFLVRDSQMKDDVQSDSLIQTYRELLSPGGQLSADAQPHPTPV